MAFLYANLDRPRLAATYADEHIERWAPVYLANPLLRLYGVPFESFLAQPAAWLQWAGDPLRGREPSAKDAERIRRAEARFTDLRGNGQRIEKLRHRAHPRSHRATFHREEEFS